MAATSPLKFTASGDAYNVERRTDGRHLGQVRKGSTYYNLAPRPATYYHWTATKADGKAITGSDGKSQKFSNRAEAAEALLNAVSIRLHPEADADGHLCEGCEGSSKFAPESSKGFCAACIEAARANGHVEQVGTREEVRAILVTTVAEGMGEEIGLPSLGHREEGPNGAVSQAARWLLRTADADVLLLAELECGECGTAVADFDDEDRNLHRVVRGSVLVGCEGFHTALLRAAHKARVAEVEAAIAAVVTADTGLSVDDLSSPERAYYALARYAADVADIKVSRMGVEEFADTVKDGEHPKDANIAEVIEYAASLDEGINLTEDEENLLRRFADEWFSYMDLDRVRAFMRPEGYRWPTPADVAAAIVKTKEEIVEDIAEEVVPADVPDFSALHSYTDANCYGGFDDEDGVEWTGEDGLGMLAVNVVQTVVDEWLKAGRPAD